jgi:hypothetical protein
MNQHKFVAFRPFHEARDYVFITLGVVLVAGLVVIPAIEAQARSLTALERNKGQRGSDKSGGQKSNGGCGRLCNI